MAAFFLLVVSLGLVALRFHMPWVRSPQGELIRKVNVPMRAKVRLQRPNVYAIGVLMLLGGIGGWVPAVAQIAVVLAVAGILIMPVDYTITDREIALGRTPARSWTDFVSIESRPGRLLLNPIPGAADFEVWLPGNAGSTAIEADLRRLVRGGAQGRTTLAPPSKPSATGGGTARNKRAI
jgi:hypothetical protein